MLDDGKRIFRYDTFGSEDFWGGKLRLHEAIVGQKLGGVGPGVSPKLALSLGLKVDAEALPADLVAAIKAGKVNMDDPASTVGFSKLTRRGGPHFQCRRFCRSCESCALCHSTWTILARLCKLSGFGNVFAVANRWLLQTSPFSDARCCVPTVKAC